MATRLRINGELPRTLPSIGHFNIITKTCDLYVNAHYISCGDNKIDFARYKQYEYSYGHLINYNDTVYDLSTSSVAVPARSKFTENNFHVVSVSKMHLERVISSQDVNFCVYDQNNQILFMVIITIDNDDINAEEPLGNLKVWANDTSGIDAYNSSTRVQFKKPYWQTDSQYCRYTELNLQYFRDIDGNYKLCVAGPSDRYLFNGSDVIQSSKFNNRYPYKITVDKNSHGFAIHGGDPRGDEYGKNFIITSAILPDGYIWA